MSRTSWGPDTRRMRLALRVLGLGFLGLLALVVAAYVVHGVVGTVTVGRAVAAARSDVDDRRAPAADHADRDWVAVRSALARLGAPTYSFSELACDLASSDAGWIVQEYTQECVVRSVDLYPVAAGPRRCAWGGVGPSVAPSALV